MATNRSHYSPDLRLVSLHRPLLLNFLLFSILAQTTLAAISNCETYSQSSLIQSCEKCYDGYYAGSSGQICNRCMDHCDKCTSASDCSRCSDGYFFNSTSSNCQMCRVPGCQNCNADPYSCENCLVYYEKSQDPNSGVAICLEPPKKKLLVTLIIIGGGVLLLAILIGVIICCCKSSRGLCPRNPPPPGTANQPSNPYVERPGENQNKIDMA